MRRLLPVGATGDAVVLLQTRAARAFADGLVSIALSAYFISLGFSARRIGILTTATLVGSAALTLAVGLRGHRLARRRLLRTVAVLMFATGVAYASLRAFWPLLIVSFVGTLNPSAGDVSVFLPTEQALLPATVADGQRTSLYARSTMVGFVLAALGALAARLVTGRAVFVVYCLAALFVLWRYGKLSAAVEPPEGRPAVPLGPSRRTVYRLAAVFSLDSFGGGFVIESLVVLWLFRRFGLSVGTAGEIFFVTRLLSGFSGLLAPRLAGRIGLVRTMVFTHLPANGFLMLTAFMPNVTLAVICLVARSALSQMDVPARQSYVMAVVTPEERPAAASVTNVPRSLASALTPAAAGWMLEHSRFGWPLLVGGACKATYDLVLLFMFRHVHPPEEAERALHFRPPSGPGGTTT